MAEHTISSFPDRESVEDENENENENDEYD